MHLVTIGKPNVGKTLLLINLAAYLGLSEVRLEMPDGEGGQQVKRLSLDRARRDLMSWSAPRTRAIQTAIIETLVGRQRIRLVAIDTPGIHEGIASHPDQRHLVALTLEWLIRAPMIVHVVDVSAVGSQRPEAPGPLDLALAQYGQRLPGYIVVANKMDKLGSLEGLRAIRDAYHEVPILPVSCITRRGFRDLKQWMLHMVT
ncbi:MAG: 50S ribosome-binding GTPase [Firmicutes bacterium]|nr:50S ribosome-binding GTPase [Bacillota bacterium]